MLQIVTGLLLIAAKAGQILHNDAVDFARALIIHQALKSWTLKVCPGPAVVTVYGTM